MKRLFVAPLVLLFFVQPAPAPDEIELQLLSQLRREGLENSEISGTVSYLTDVVGPRLTGSPNLRRGFEWAKGRLEHWGLENIRLEPWEDFGRGWEMRKCRVEMVEPYYAPLIAYPPAWTRGLDGPLEGVPIRLRAADESEWEAHRGKLRGAIVMVGEAPEVGPRFEPEATRYGDEALEEIQRQRIGPGPGEERRREFRARREQRRKLREFLGEEGVGVIVETGRGSGGTVIVTGGGSHRSDESLGPPTVVLAPEHFGRILRILDQGVDARLRIELETAVFEDQATQYNLLADIPGSDPEAAGEIVMLGAHIDSWHVGTGATDNAAGSSVVMEAVRLLRALDARPRRTIRLALWSGEEQGLLGSRAYVRRFLGDPETGEFTDKHGRLSAYFNLDNGTGRIRGVYLQGNDAVRPFFRRILEPLRDLGVTTISIRDTGGTDHLPFDAVGIPAFQFIQDPVAYGTSTHHGNMDLFEHVVEEDLRQAAVVMAWVVHSAAVADEPLPRKPWVPRPRSEGSR
jgi:carboxypeptidase Q